MARQGRPFQMTPLESSLRRLAAALNEAALESLASRGLLRRARKDLELDPQPRIEGERDGAMLLRIGGCEVCIPPTGPATATCSCPSAGVCQHILTAVLFLQQPGSSVALPAVVEADAENASAAPEFLELSSAQLEQWAGRAAWKAALQFLTRTTPEVTRGPGVRVRFPEWNVECHLVSQGGLDGAIVSGAILDRKRVVAAAVVALQRAEGVAWDLPAAKGGLGVAEGAPRTRDEVCRACQLLLHETVANGLSRLSPANQQRWATLAVSALGVNLPRLALALRGISNEAELALARDARSDLSRMFERMARLHALCSALRSGGTRPSPDHVGLHRTRYDPVGHLDLIGVAAWPWRAASGYEGLTVLFWDAAARRWNSWTDARPRQQLHDFNPASRFTQPGPWAGADSPGQLARSTFRLMNARRNGRFRLSGSSGSRVLVTGPATPCPVGMPLFTEWQLLEEHLANHRAVGLKEPDPLSAVVAIQPATWAGRRFDEMSQCLRWWLLDKHDQGLLLEVRFDDLAEPAIRALEQLPVNTLEKAVLIGRTTGSTHGLRVHPLSLHRPALGITHLALDGAAVSAQPPGEPAEDDGIASEEAEPDSTLADPASPLAGFLGDLEDALLAHAESGTAGASRLNRDRVGRLARSAHRIGSEVLADALNAWLDQPHNASQLLRCRYLAALHRDATPVMSQ
jgi:hypothetical protein